MTISRFILAALLVVGVAGVAHSQVIRFDDRGFNFRFGKDDRRGDVEGKRASCELYARIASVQVDANDRYRCGFRGPQWDRDAGNHFRWCRWARRDELARDQLVRARSLQDCFNRLGDFDDRR